MNGARLLSNVKSENPIIPTTNKGFSRPLSAYELKTQLGQRLIVLRIGKNKMGLVTPDLSEVAPDLEPGDYHARFTDVKTKVGSKSGTPFLAWTLEIQDAEIPEQNGTRVFLNTMTAGPGVAITKRVFKAAVGEDMPESWDTDVLLGKVVRIVVTTDAEYGVQVKAVKPLANAA